MAKDEILRQLGAHSGQILFWSMPAARILFLAWAYADFRLAPSSLSQAMLSLWAAWASATTIAAFFGKPLLPSMLKIFWAVDVSMVILTIILMSNAGAASFAFAICIACSARICFAQTFPQLITLGLPATVWVLKSTFLQQVNADSLSPNSTWHPEITLSLVVMTMWVVAFMAIRRSQWEKFLAINSEIKSQIPGNPVDPNLQAWVDKLAQLYSPNKATLTLVSHLNKCVLQCIERNLPLTEIQNSTHDLMTSISCLPEGCTAFDFGLNICVPSGQVPRQLLDREKPLAQLLKRSGISVALIQPIQIDRLEGAVICAVKAKIGPALLAEAVVLNQLILNFSQFLDHKAAAERNFIADAHDVARRDLHDGVLQTLAALRMRLSAIARRKELSNDDARLDIRKTLDIITLEQTRLRGLLETDTQNDGTVNLVTRLDVCLRSISLQWDIVIKLKAEDPAVPMDSESALNIENLMREVMANAVRHTASQSLTVSLSLKHDALMLVVNDLMPAAIRGHKKQMASLPLQSSSLRQRLRIANAEAYAEGLDQGMLLSIRIPMEQIDDA